MARRAWSRSVANHPGKDYADEQAGQHYTPRDEPHHRQALGLFMTSAAGREPAPGSQCKPIRFSANSWAWVESASGSPTAAPSSPMSSRSSAIDSALWACESTPAHQVQRHAAHQEHLGNQSHSASSPSAGANHARSFSARIETGSAFEPLERRRDLPQAVNSVFPHGRPGHAAVPLRPGTVRPAKRSCHSAGYRPSRSKRSCHSAGYCPGRRGRATPPRTGRPGDER